MRDINHRYSLQDQCATDVHRSATVGLRVQGLEVRMFGGCWPMLMLVHMIYSIEIRA